MTDNPCVFHSTAYVIRLVPLTNKYFNNCTPATATCQHLYSMCDGYYLRGLRHHCYYQPHLTCILCIVCTQILNDEVKNIGTKTTAAISLLKLTSIFDIRCFQCTMFILNIF